MLLPTSNFDEPVDVIIEFQISGVNEQIKQLKTGSQGTALLEYETRFAGVDRITATAFHTGLDILSNTLELDLGAGRHTSFLSLNGSVVTGVPGQPSTVHATLVDISLVPPVAVSGESIDFSVGSWGCSAVTDSLGKASCVLSPQTAGNYSLQAIFSGSAGLTPDEDSRAFNVFEPPSFDYLFGDGFEGVPE